MKAIPVPRNQKVSFQANFLMFQAHFAKKIR